MRLLTPYGKTGGSLIKRFFRSNLQPPRRDNGSGDALHLRKN
jgi:hypothetical protein